MPIDPHGRLFDCGLDYLADQVHIPAYDLSINGTTNADL